MAAYDVSFSIGDGLRPGSIARARPRDAQTLDLIFFLADMLRVFLRTLFAWQRLRGRRLGLVDGQTGSVTFLQRFGGILNLNPHVRCLLPDGLFVPGTAQRLVFAPLQHAQVSRPERRFRRIAAQPIRLSDRSQASLPHVSGAPTRRVTSPSSPGFS